MAALYGADSVVSFDGACATGAAAVAATFAGPRLAGGPVALRFSSVDAQFTPGGLALVVATGEATAPAGRFATAWLLAPLPGGGMYVRAQFDRHGPGGAPQNTGADGTGMGAGFLGQYYGLYAANRPALAGVYRPTSQLAFENKPVATGDAIARHLADSRDAATGETVPATLPPGAHSVTALDAAQVSGAPPTVLALATGSFAIAGQQHPMNFAQAFVLVADATGPHVSNEVFKFNYA